MLHSDEKLKRIFEQYRVDLRDLERQKAALDTETGKQLESLSDTAGIQCEITETKEGVIVTYYRLNPNNLTSADLEPTRAKSVFYDGEFYYTKEEWDELQEEDDDDVEATLGGPDGQAGVQDPPGVFAPEQQPQGPRPDLFNEGAGQT